MIIFVLVLILLAICFPDAIGALIGGIIGLAILGAGIGLIVVVLAMIAS